MQTKVEEKDKMYLSPVTYSLLRIGAMKKIRLGEYKFRLFHPVTILVLPFLILASMIMEAPLKEIMKEAKNLFIYW